MKTCFRCKQTKPKADFYRDRSRGPNGFASECKACSNKRHRPTHKAYIRQYHKDKTIPAMRKLIADHKADGCALCGYNKCDNALQFHHLSDKSQDVSKIKTSISAVKREIEKCILVCANCHAEIHAGMHDDILNLPPVQQGISVNEVQPKLFDYE